MAILVAGLFAGCTTVKTTPTPTVTPVKTATPAPAPTATPTPTSVKTPTKPISAATVATVNCSVCHTKATDYPPHKDGNGCIKCHGSDPHKIHVGKGTINLKCSVCHGSGEKIHIPKAANGQPSCVLCHDPVDPLKPFGNYVNVHLGRGKPCTVCHTQGVAKIHSSADAFAK